MITTYFPIRLIFISSFLLLSTTSFGQYIESFPTAEKGILLGPCPGGTAASCASTDFTGVDWTINGNFTGVDAVPGVEDYLKTIAGVFEFGGDIDEELCLESPILDISSVAGNASLSVDIVWNSQDGADYIDVEYQINGGGWTQIPNQVGGGIHTIDYGNSGNSGSGTISQTGLSGNTLSVRVCVDTNTSSERTTIDNLSVPEANVMVLLPVELISFRGQTKEQGVLLKWETASEINNKKFEIEHSVSGKEFQKIGEVAGNGTTNGITQYSFNHDIPSLGQNYYRLKQIDFDGHFVYSEIVSVRFDTKKDYVGWLYPNPSNTGIVYLAYFAFRNSDAEILVYNTSGKYISRQYFTLVKGENNLNLDLKALTKGTYFIKIRNESISYWRKLIID